MRNRLPLAAALAAALLASGAAAARAENQTFNFDPNHSLVSFSIRHFFTKVTGRFNNLSGSVSFDPKNWPAASTDLSIKTASIFTNNEMRDSDLRSDHFFLADSFPAITFKSTKVVPGQGDKFQVVGDLTMHGVTKPVTLDVSYLGQGDTGMGGRSMGVRAGFEATTTIDRKNWGIVWNRALDQGGTMLGDDVTINISIEAVKAGPKSAAGAAPQGGTR